MIILGTNSIKDTGFNVDNSCRFDGSSSSLTKAQGASPSSNLKGTFSMWLKKSSTTADQHFLNVVVDVNNRTFINFTGDQQLQIAQKDGGSDSFKLFSNAKFRDPSAWMNLVIAFDTANGTASNRIKVYMNGTQITSWQIETYPTQNRVVNLLDETPISIGAYNNASNYFDGYMAQVIHVNNQALTPTSFGEFDEDSGIWKPIDITGLTVGTNGYFLDFEDASNLGNDASGGTDFTENNIAATDQSTDTCTNNFATLNSLINFNSGVFTEGNLAITSGDDTVSTIGLTSGRWYWEAQRTNTTNEAHIGIGVSKGFFSATSVVSSGDRIYVRGGATFVSAVSNLGILTFASNSGTPATISNGDVIGFYLDLESSTKNITVKKNDGATPIIDIDLTYSGEEPIFPFCRMNSGCASSWNFGNPIASLSSANADANGFGSFEFNPTKGGVDYFAICTKNLAEYGG